MKSTTVLVWVAFWAGEYVVGHLIVQHVYMPWLHRTLVRFMWMMSWFR